MLQFIREKAKGWVAWFIISLLTFTFLLWGVQNYSGHSDQHEILATVGGVPINRQAVQRQYQRLQEAWLAKLGTPHPILDEKIQSRLQKQALEELIIAQVLVQSAVRDGFRVSPALLGRTVVSMPYFQQKGRFSNEQYEQVLYRMGYSRESFLAELEQSVLLSQIKEGITQSAFVLPHEVTHFFNTLHETRDMAYLIVPKPKVSVGDAAVRQYYEAHAEQFKMPEKVSVDYIHSHDPRVTDQLTELTYTHPDTLTSAASALRLAIQHTGLFTRQGQGLEKESNTIFHDPRVIAAAFSEEVLSRRNNSLPITLDDGSTLVLRVKQYQPGSVRPLNEVKDNIGQILAAEQIQRESKQFAEEITRQLENHSLSPEKLAKQYRATWKRKVKVARDTKGLLGEVKHIVDKGFEIEINTPQRHYPVFKAYPLNQKELVIIKIEAVYPGKSNPSLAESQKTQQQLEQVYAQLEYNLYVKSKRNKAKIVRVGS